MFVCWCFDTIFKNRCFFDGIFEELFIYVFCVCFFAVFLGVFLGVFWLFFCSWVFSRAFSKFVFYSGCFFVIYLKMGVFFVCVFFHQSQKLLFVVWFLRYFFYSYFLSFSRYFLLLVFSMFFCVVFCLKVIIWSNFKVCVLFWVSLKYICKVVINFGASYK